MGSIKKACEVIGIRPRTYYYRPKVDAALCEKQDDDLRDEIETIQAENPGYGYRRVYHHMKRAGEKINAKRIRRVMDKYGLEPLAWTTFVRTTDSNHDQPICENLVKGRQVTGINQVWVADLTYIRILTCFVYLAVILDVFSRKVIGWAISKRLDRSLCLEALRMAIRDRRPPSGCIHHSDRGIAR